MALTGLVEPVGDTVMGGLDDHADCPEFADVVGAVTEARVDEVLVTVVQGSRCHVELDDRPRAAGTRVGRRRAVRECDDAA